MNDPGSGYDLCPFCGESFAIVELPAHANSHFATPPASPPNVEVTILTNTNVQTPTLTHHQEWNQERLVEVGFLPSDASSLTGVQTRDDQFIEGLNSMASFESVFHSTKHANNKHNYVYIAGPVQHFNATADDKGWGCGYRNAQMLISYLLLKGEPFQSALFGGVGYVPDIQSLQAWLECAWTKGYDPEGQHMLEGSVQGSRKWVGALDIAILLRQFGVNTQFIDFFGTNSSHHPNYEGGTVHTGFKCDICHARPIVGRRYTSIGVQEYDLCEHCYTTPDAQISAPYTQHGQQEKHIGAKCRDCDMSPIVGVRYQRNKNWRFTLCQACYHKRSHLDQPNFRHQLRSRPSNVNSNTHQRLIQWTWNYFTQGVEIDDEDESDRFFTTTKSPLFFQHDGHSRTIVGIERVVTTGRNASVEYNLMILDPSTSATSLQHSFARGVGWQRLLKRGAPTLRQPEFQIVYADGFVESEQERERLKRVQPMDQIFS